MQKQEIEEYNKLCAIFIGWTVGNFINKYPNYFYLKSMKADFIILLLVLQKKLE